MPVTSDTEYKHIGETSGCKNHDHDLVHELSRRLDGMWQDHQYIVNEDGQVELQTFGRHVKSEEQKHIVQLKKLISRQIENKSF